MPRGSNTSTPALYRAVYEFYLPMEKKQIEEYKDHEEPEGGKDCLNHTFNNERMLGQDIVTK